MIILSLQEQIALLVFSIISVSIILSIIGKFFHIKPFRNIYDYIQDDPFLVIGTTMMVLMNIISWILYIFDASTLFSASLTLNTIILVGFLLLSLLFWTIETFIPFMHNLHEKIVDKKEGKL